MPTAPPFPPSDAPAASTSPSAAAAPAPTPGLRGLLTPENLGRAAIVGLAAFLRLLWLDQRPPHFDEGVNGWFTDQMQRTGFYNYDPSNYHGPLHFYVLFVFKTLLGRNLWALRLPVALVGILTVDWVFRFRAFFGRRVCALAALALAISPGTLFFHRDAIHETWLVFFLVLAFWGLCGLWQLGEKRHLWALALGLTGAVLTKETYLVHVGCFLCALPVLWLLEENLPSARRPLLAESPPPPLEPGGRSLWNPEADQTRFFDRFQATCAPQRYRPGTVFAVAGVSLALVVFFYSGNFCNWPGLKGLITSFEFWGHTAHDTKNGHVKDFIYWTQLLLLNEPVAAVGLFACLRYVVPPLGNPRYRPLGVALLVLCAGLLAFEFWPGHPFFHHWRAPAITNEKREHAYQLRFVVVTTALMIGAVSCLALPRPADWRLRLLAIYAPGTFVAYSLIPYKTPWCAVSFIWPFFFVLAANLVEWVDLCAVRAVRAAAWGAGGALAALSAWWTVDVNYLRPTDERVSAAAACLMLDLRCTPYVDDHLAYVYVQTYDGLWTVTEPLLGLVRDDPARYHLKGVILCGSTYPLPWLLGDFTGIDYYGDDKSPADYRADFLLVEERRVAEAEPRLDAAYFKASLQLRPAQGTLTLYLRASLFADYFPGRQPEFHPVPPEAVPPEVEPPDEPDPTPAP